MATVTDNFNRADNPASLGTATSGQSWAAGLGAATAGILSNQAVITNSGAGVDIITLIDALMNNAVVKVFLMNADAGGIGLRNQGVVARFADASHFMFLTYSRAAGGFRFYVRDDWNGSAQNVAPDNTFTLNDGDSIALACCGQVCTAYHNDVAVFSVNFGPTGLNLPQSATLLNATQYGLQGDNTAVIFENFSVVLNDDCKTWNCTESGCVDPGDGTGQFTSLTACQVSCGIPPTYNCLDGVCCDPGDGSGAFLTLAECQAAGCGSTISGGSGTMRFNDGIGSRYYVVPPISDSGSETRSKVMKSGRVTGKVTSAKVKFYPYDVDDEINVTDLEEGTNSATDVSLTDTSQVAQSQRQQVNIPNAVLSTARVEGDDRGEETRDRIDEIVIEQAIQGVRR